MKKSTGRNYGSKASDNYKVYKNPNGPKLSTVTRKIIEKEGLYFKDIDGTGEVSKVNDWRLPAAESAKAYAELLTAEEKSDSSSFLTGVWANILHQMYRMIPIVQGSEDGVTTDGVEMLDKAERIGFAVNHSGVDVIRGKDQHLPDELKDENGKAYAYRDAAGNYYEMNFGLTY